MSSIIETCDFIMIGQYMFENVDSYYYRLLSKDFKILSAKENNNEIIIFKIKVIKIKYNMVHVQCITMNINNMK